jgi:hypothetical protein
MRVIFGCGFELLTKGPIAHESKGDTFREVPSGSRERPNVFFLIKPPDEANDAVAILVRFLYCERLCVHVPGTVREEL